LPVVPSKNYAPVKIRPRIGWADFFPRKIWNNGFENAFVIEEAKEFGSKIICHKRSPRGVPIM
jgi:hypothetical protein